LLLLYDRCAEAHVVKRSLPLRERST
jgi:hypothetical protein